MDSNSTMEDEFSFGTHSSLARGGGKEAEIPANVRLMYLAKEVDIDGIRELLEESGTTDVNYRDVDGRTALHVAACQGFPGVVKLLVEHGARVDPQDRRGSTMQFTTRTRT